MTQRIEPGRRRALRLLGLAAVGLAGCATGQPAGGPQTQETDATTVSPADGTATAYEQSGDDEAETEGEPTRDSNTAQETSRTSGAPTTSSATNASLDLREANVIAVALETRDGAVRFSVTLYHDDDGEEGYADWWQVESLDGERLGRRELLHAHSTDPFTRSETVDVPDGITCVVVRGHDQTHGYGGQAMLVDLDSGETRGVDQGSEPRSFSADECP